VPIVKVNSQSRMKKVSVTAFTIATLMLVVLSAGVALSQTNPPPPTPSPTPFPKPIDGTFKNADNTPLTTFEEEIRAKREIKMAEKDHEENLSRAREIAQIGKELKESAKDRNTLDRDCWKKIDRLEKLTKKVRSEAGGEDEDVSIEKRPSDLPAALSQIAETSESLAKKVQDTPRQVVSATVIGNANVLLELIKLARSFGRLPH
jgi:hypothetical protein